jgi:hypothetical protein
MESYGKNMVITGINFIKCQKIKKKESKAIPVTGRGSL